MPLTQPMRVERKEAKGFELLPEDMYQVELLDVSSVQRPTYETRHLPQDQQELDTVLNFDFALLEGEERGRHLWANFVPSTLYISKKNGKNKLYQIIESLIGHEVMMPEYTEMAEDASTFLNNLIGKQCRVMVKHKQSGDKVFANPVEFLTIKSLLPALSREEKAKFALKKTSEAPSASVQEGDPNYIRPEEIPF